VSLRHVTDDTDFRSQYNAVKGRIRPAGKLSDRLPSWPRHCIAVVQSCDVLWTCSETPGRGTIAVWASSRGAHSLSTAAVVVSRPKRSRRIRRLDDSQTHCSSSEMQQNDSYTKPKLACDYVLGSFGSAYISLDKSECMLSLVLLLVLHAGTPLEHVPWKRKYYPNLTDKFVIT